MKAKIWMDRDTGRWHWDLESHGVRSTGDRASWQAVLNEVFAEMRWIEAHQAAWGKA